MENLYSLTGFQWLVIFGLSIGAGAIGALVSNAWTRYDALLMFLGGSVGTFIIILISRIYLY